MTNKIYGIIERNVGKITTLSSYEKYTFSKILKCRTERIPYKYSYCDNCGTIHPVFKSCKNRMCPNCNNSSTVKWVAKREAELLPTGYFMLTFTIPSELKPLFLYNKKICYNLLFKASSSTLIEAIENNKRSFHGKAGFFSTLHTWDQKLNFHPHIHIVIPAGCLNEDKTKWNPSPSSFLLPVRKLSADFRNNLLFYLSKVEKKEPLNIPEGMEDLNSIFEKVKQISWVVNSQAPGENRNPQKMIRYLSRYVNKTAVSDKRIKKVENGKVYLKFIDRKRKQEKIEIIDELLFMKRLVFHILPKGFKKTRFYGFMSNRYRKKSLVLCRMLLGIPFALQEESRNLDDTVFLFWKYFNVDITLCRNCHKGHISYINTATKGG